jgi:diacylglycerol kinase family enzyme
MSGEEPFVNTFGAGRSDAFTMEGTNRNSRAAESIIAAIFSKRFVLRRQKSARASCNAFYFLI